MNRKIFSLLFLIHIMLVVSATTPDPGLTGSYAVSSQTYDFGDNAFTATNFPAAIEVRAIVHYPTNLSTGPFPLIILLHGRHETCYDASGGYTTAYWPCSGLVEIPSYLGYNYLAQKLASNGYIVVSIGANAISASDGTTGDQGMSARAELIQHHLSLWKQFNTTGGSPFGNTFVGKVDLTRVGTMGHSRGGEGVVTNAIYNKNQGSPYGIKAVLAVAPTNFYRPVLNNIPLAVVLPYCDGDVLDLQGVHYYDDARYSSATDIAPKHTMLMMGANHNYFNTVWTPGLFAAGTDDDWTFIDQGYDSHCFTGASGNKRFTDVKQRAALVGYACAFFRTYVGGEKQFSPILEMEDPLPPSSSALSAPEIHLSYHPAATNRRDINRTNAETTKTTNTLGGTASQNGLTNYNICGESFSEQYCLGLNSFQEPHNRDNVNASTLGLIQLELMWNNTSDYYENSLPAQYQNIAQFHSLQFRAAVNFEDVPSITTSLDLSVQLHGTNGDTQTVRVSNYSNVLNYPPGTLNGYMPRLIQNTIKLPLAAFNKVDLSHIDAIRFNFNKSASGAINISDLIFSSDSVVRAVPVALFAANITSTCDGNILFTDNSAGNPSAWTWNFGDGTTSTLQNPAHTYAVNGTYPVKLSIYNTAGKDSLTKISYITVNRPPAPTVTGAKSCNPGVLNLMAAAAGGGTLNWYDALTGGNKVNTGTTYSPNLSVTTNYYVEENTAGSPIHGGKPDNSTGGGGYLNNIQGLIFNVLKTCTLKAVTVYAQGDNTRTIELVDANNTVVQTISPYIANGQQKVTLNFVLTPGNNYTLRANNISTVDLYRNNDGVGLSYPYNISNLISIVNTTAAVSNPSDYYYFFYDWEVEGIPCLSERALVKGEILNCTGLVQSEVDNDFTIYPNPAKNILTIEKVSYTEKYVELEIKNVLGETVLTSSIENSGNVFKKALNVESLTPGVYFISVKGENTASLLKFMKAG